MAMVFLLPWPSHGYVVADGYLMPGGEKRSRKIIPSVADLKFVTQWTEDDERISNPKTMSLLVSLSNPKFVRALPEMIRISDLGH